LLEAPGVEYVELSAQRGLNDVFVDSLAFPGALDE